MVGAGALLRSSSLGGRSPGAVARRARVAVVCAAAALLALAGCATTATRAPLPPGVAAGLALHDAGDYALAARRFREAADEARRLRDLEIERRIRAAECTAWLHARSLREFDRCTLRLDTLRRQASRPDPGVNTLIALGAIAGARPLPPYRLPAEVRGTLRAAAGEERR